ncbi:MAG: Gfo/Idh/MocA family protein, partial [Planctomycetaceae bacterium]
SQPQSQRQPPPAASPVAAPQQPPSLVGGRLETRSAAAAPPPTDRPPIRRLGMIGLDTSHVPAFTRLFNKELADDPRLGGLRVVAGVKAGNPDFPLSRDRVEGFTREIEQLGVQIVPDIATLLTQVDGVLLQSVDGNQHLEQARPVLEAGVPLFIDKPLAASLADAQEIARLADRHQVPWFTASSSRFTAGYPELRNNPEIGEILGCDTYSQSRGAPGHPDLFWYGIHGIDLLYSLLGAGCVRVTALQTPWTEQVTGQWRDGRVGCYRSIREQTGKTGLGAAVFGKQGIAHCHAYYDYAALVLAIGRFFLQRQSPIPPAEMVEVVTFMAAAEESKRRGGLPVDLATVAAAATSRPR